MDKHYLKDDNNWDKIKTGLDPHFLKDSDIGTKIQAYGETNVIDNILDFQNFTDFEVEAVVGLIETANLFNYKGKKGNIHIINADKVYGWSSEFTFAHNYIPQPMDDEMHLKYQIINKKGVLTVKITVI